MKKKPEGIVATFKYLDDICFVAEKIKENKSFAGHEILAPASYHELMDVAEKQYGPSQVRWFTLVGALSGVTAGFAMPLWMDYDWPLVVGGKTAGVYSLPAYVVFGFELMILLGAIATIAGMLFMGRLPNPLTKIYHEKITDDLFAVFVPNTTEDGEQAKLLKELGAEEIRATT